LQETKHSLALVADEKKVTIELETEPELTWDTIPELLQNIVYNLAHNAVKFAGKSSGGNKSGSNKGGRVLLRAQRMDQNLWIDVLNTGHPLDVRHSDQVFIRGTTTSDDFPSLTPHGYGLCQLVTINGRSCWTIAGLES
jgi:signal transduction histidine kinase